MGNLAIEDGQHYLTTTESPSGTVEEPEADEISFDGQDEITMGEWKFKRLPDAKFEIPDAAPIR